MSEYKVTASTAGPLLPFLFGAMADRKRTDVRRLLSYDRVSVNGQPTRDHALFLKAGDVVSVNTSRAMNAFHDSRVQLLYEDDDLLVINKTAGLMSEASDMRGSRRGKEPENAFSIMRSYVKRKNPRADLFILHRLDRDTSGVLAFAKSQNVQEAMRSNWNNQVRERRYIAVVQGRLEPAEGIIRSYLAEDRAHNVYSTDNPAEGRLAITRYKALAHGNGMTLAEVRIDTGRKNQIRVHMREAGHPVIGDNRYGSKGSPLGRMCLHAEVLSFIHPTTRQLVSFTAPAPSSFRALVEPSPSESKP